MWLALVNRVLSPFPKFKFNRGFGPIHSFFNRCHTMKNPYKTIIKNLGLTYKTILGESSAKTIKGETIGYLTGIVYLKPDHTICAMAALAGCMNGCLESAGRGAFNSVQLARIAKTRFYYEHQQSFLLSSRTVFMLSIHKASTGPSKMTHFCLSLVSCTAALYNSHKMPSVHS